MPLPELDVRFTTTRALKEQSVFALSSHRASIEQGRACVPPESSVRTEQVHCRVSVLVATV